MGTPFEPITTERLIVRPPVAEDLDALLARRNHPDVARYQDWELPYTPEQATARLQGAIDMGGLENDDWWMATVVLPGQGGKTVIGDLAVNVTWNWRAAEIGYSFDPDHWGKGYAGEAVNAMLDHLFDDVGIQRAYASLHPDNPASAMLLERAGFSFEGQTKQSFWLGDGPDAENSDGSFYGMTAADRQAWLSRRTGPADEVTLIDITAENQRQVSRLATHRSQERMVSTVLESFADAMFPEAYGGQPVTPRMWAIEADRDLAGFVMIALSTEHQPEPYLWRLLIDRRFQRRGIGGRAVDLVEQFCRARGDATLTVSWEEGKGSPEPFYLQRGFVPTGNRPHDEVEARKQL